MASVTGSFAISRYRLPLKLRVAVACTGIGLVLSLLFAGSTIFITERFEDVIVEQLLKGEAADDGTPVGNQGGGQIAAVANPLRRYVAIGGDRSRIPAVIRDLPNGLQEFTDASGDERAVGIYERGNQRIYVTIDLGSVDQLEDLLNVALIAIILLGATISGWLGWWWAGKSVLPVTRLAAAVDALPLQPESTQLASAFGRDEVGRLAAAIDHYQNRLVDAKDRESRFFAGASHELRTPMAVVRGVVDVMMDSEGSQAERRRRLRRLERGMGELTDKADAMFVLARNRLDPSEPVDVARLLRECIDDLQMHLPETATIRVDMAPERPIPLSRRQAQLVFRALMRSVLSAEDPGELGVQFAYPEIRIRYGAAGHEWGGPVVADSQPNDLRVENTLVGRLAMAMGWSIQGTVTGAEKSYSIVLAPFR